jgi:hypothetical protein
VIGINLPLNIDGSSTSFFPLLQLPYPNIYIVFYTACRSRLFLSYSVTSGLICIEKMASCRFGAIVSNCLFNAVLCSIGEIMMWYYVSSFV